MSAKCIVTTDSIASPETHVSVGVFRCSFPDLASRFGQSYACPVCGSVSHYDRTHITTRLFACWQSGHFDEPVYVTHAQALKMKEVG